jgi:hypothetical protein
LFQNKASYDKVLQVLKDLRAFPPGECMKTMTDFEQALLLAMDEALPWAEVKIFHY